MGRKYSGLTGQKMSTQPEEVSVLHEVDQDDLASLSIKLYFNK